MKVMKRRVRKSLISLCFSLQKGSSAYRCCSGGLSILPQHFSRYISYIRMVTLGVFCHLALTSCPTFEQPVCCSANLSIPSALLETCLSFLRRRVESVIPISSKNFPQLVVIHTVKTFSIQLTSNEQVEFPSFSSQWT